MQGLAKKSIHIMFTEAQLVSFGNFLFQRYDVKVHSSDGKNQPIYQRQVGDADISNWKVDSEVPDKSILPSDIQIGERAWLRLWSDNVIVEIHAVHFTAGKVKYDLNVSAHDGNTTRLYNVDSVFVHKKIAVNNQG